MPYKKIIIIGSPGAGKSTLARQLGDIMGLEVIHLDKLFWTDNWVNVSSDEFDRRLAEAMRAESWIIDGNYSRTAKIRFDAADTVIFLDYPRRVCLWGVIKRIITNHGRTRADMSDNCPERFDPEFVRYVWNFNKNERRKWYDIIGGCGAKNVHILKSRRDCAELAAQLKKHGVN